MREKTLSRSEIAQKCHLQLLDEFLDHYIDIVHKHQESIGLSKYNLGLAKNVTHNIHLKDQDPLFQKQSKLLEAHHQFIEQMLNELLKLGFVKRSNSLFNLPIFCIPKKPGQGLQIIQDYLES